MFPKWTIPSFIHAFGCSHVHWSWADIHWQRKWGKVTQLYLGLVFKRPGSFCFLSLGMFAYEIPWVINKTSIFFFFFGKFTHWGTMQLFPTSHHDKQCWMEQLNILMKIPIETFKDFFKIPMNRSAELMLILTRYSRLPPDWGQLVTQYLVSINVHLIGLFVLTIFAHQYR